MQVQTTAGQSQATKNAALGAGSSHQSSHPHTAASTVMSILVQKGLILGQFAPVPCGTTPPVKPELGFVLPGHHSSDAGRRLRRSQAGAVYARRTRV